VRRATILNELQTLAAHLDGFPQQDRHRVIMRHRKACCPLSMWARTNVT
jgi:hypothetical protein